MKRILKHFLIDTYALYLTSQFAKGMLFERGYRSLFVAGAAVTLVSLFAKPIINLLLLPLNLITFGFFRWVAAAVILFLVTLLVKDFKIIYFAYSGFKSVWIDLPSLNFQGIMAFIAFSFILSIITSFIYWLIK